MPSYISGLDLGQQQDYTALVTVERDAIASPWPNQPTTIRHDVRHIHRWQLGTPYPAIIENLQEWFRSPMLRGSTLVVDATGVGVAVVDMIRRANLTCTIRPYTITAGFKEGVGTVPKKDLVAAVVAAMQTRRLRRAESIPLMATLTKELETFRVKVTPDRNETYSAWREKDHDDLVLATALAVWYGEKYGGWAAGEDPYGYDRDAPLPPELPRDTFR